jgi:hypothetical protein
VFKKILLAAVAPLAVLGSVALAGGAANAAPLPVTASHFSFDEITGITETEVISTPATTDTLTFQAAHSGPGLTWSASYPTGFGGSSITGDAVTLVAGTGAASGTFTVEAKDTAGAAGFATVSVTVSSGDITSAVISSTATESLFIANHLNGDPTLNASHPGTVVTTIAPLADGFDLAGEVLSSGSAGVGTYNGVTVTATNPATGAVAVESFTAKVGPVVIIPIHPVVPYVYAGHVITVDNNSATVGWSDSTLGWPSANHCVEVREFGYGFTVNGSPHVGFTCDNGNPAQDVGYLSGLAAHHTYFLQVVPAVGTYGDNHQIPGTDAHGGIDVVTTS